MFMIPNITVYFYHSFHEYNESQENQLMYRHIANEQFAEFILFQVIAWGYTIMTIFVMVKPANKKAYKVIFIGTPIIIVIYYLSKTVGMPVPDFYDWWMVDNSTNWKDDVTKIAQQTFVIPLAMLYERLALRTKRC